MLLPIYFNFLKIFRYFSGLLNKESIKFYVYTRYSFDSLWGLDKNAVFLSEVNLFSYTYQNQASALKDHEWIVNNILLQPLFQMDSEPLFNLWNHIFLQFLHWFLAPKCFKY